MISLSINSVCFLQATFKPPKAIRGGIPICFPQVCASILLSVCFCNFYIFVSEFNFLRYAVWKYWFSWATWICKEPSLECWSWSPTISIKYFSQGLHWLNPQALWRRCEDLASQVHYSIWILIYLIQFLNWHFNFNALLLSKVVKLAWNNC